MIDLSSVLREELARADALAARAAREIALGPRGGIARFIRFLRTVVI